MGILQDLRGIEVPDRLLGRLLCWLGVHDFHVVSKSFEFRTDEGVEKVECSRCGLRVTRKA